MKYILLVLITFISFQTKASVNVDTVYEDLTEQCVLNTNESIVGFQNVVMDHHYLLENINKTKAILESYKKIIKSNDFNENAKYIDMRILEKLKNSESVIEYKVVLLSELKRLNSILTSEDGVDLEQIKNNLQYYMYAWTSTLEILGMNDLIEHSMLGITKSFNSSVDNEKISNYGRFLGKLVLSSLKVGALAKIEENLENEDIAQKSNNSVFIFKESDTLSDYLKKDILDTCDNETFKLNAIEQNNALKWRARTVERFSTTNGFDKESVFKYLDFVNTKVGIVSFFFEKYMLDKDVVTEYLLGIGLTKKIVTEYFDNIGFFSDLTKTIIEQNVGVFEIKDYFGKRNLKESEVKTLFIEYLDKMKTNSTYLASVDFNSIESVGVINGIEIYDTPIADEWYFIIREYMATQDLFYDLKKEIEKSLKLLKNHPNQEKNIADLTNELISVDRLYRMLDEIIRFNIIDLPVSLFADIYTFQYEEATGFFGDNEEELMNIAVSFNKSCANMQKYVSSENTIVKIIELTGKLKEELSDEEWKQTVTRAKLSQDWFNMLNKVKIKNK